MFAGWKVALGIGLAAAVGLGVQELRIAWKAEDLAKEEKKTATLTGAVAARNRDVKEAVDSAQSESEYRRFLSRAIEIEGAKVTRLLARNAALDRALAQAKKDALNVPTAPGCDDADDSWLAFIDALRVQRGVAPGSAAEAGRGDEDRAGRATEIEGNGRHLQAPPR